jgi:NADPH:quinone reductase-like Zn-dependent oxidoreductase/transposase
MRYIQPLTEEQRVLLNKTMQDDPSFRAWSRAHSLLLSAQGKTIKDMAQTYQVHRVTMSTWIHTWEQHGAESLHDQPRSGRPCTLTAAEQELARQYLKDEPRALKALLYFTRVSTCATMTEALAEASHDRLTRMLQGDWSGQTLLPLALGALFPVAGGSLIIDDTVVEKPYARRLGEAAWVRASKHRKVVFGVSVVLLVWTAGQTRIPVAFRVWKKGGPSKSALALERLRSARNRRKCKPQVVLWDSGYPSKPLLKRRRDSGWYFGCQLKKNRAFAGRALPASLPQPYWQAVGELTGGLKVLVVRHRRKDYATNRLSLTAQEVRAHDCKRPAVSPAQLAAGAPRTPAQGRHEVAGVIDAVGPGVPGWESGQRVGVGWNGGYCGYCDHCRRGAFFACVRGQTTGVTYDGGYGEYMIAPTSAVALMPADLPPVDAAPLMCTGVTTFNALRNSSARPGDVVAVLGLGGLGHLGVQYAAKMGFHTVGIARGRDKQPLARQLGASVYIDSQAQDPAAELLKLGGAKVILATVTSGEAMIAVQGGLAVNGTLLMVGVPESMQVSPISLIMGCRSVKG